MQPHSIDTLETTVRRSHTGELSFGELVPRLIDLGVGSYRVDYRSGATSYYFNNGETHAMRSHAACTEDSACSRCSKQAYR